jgi:hypothetical protein
MVYLEVELCELVYGSTVWWQALTWNAYAFILIFEWFMNVVHGITANNSKDSSRNAVILMQVKLNDFSQ